MLKSVENMAARLSNLWPWKKRINENNPGNGPSTSQEESLNRAIGPYESMFFKIQSILIWENPVLSTIFVIGINLLFWLIVTLQFRFYSVACLVTLFVFVYNLWVEEIWPEIRVPPQDSPDTEGWTPVHPSVLSAPEISHHLSETRTYLVTLLDKGCKLRQEQPALFCGISCGCLSALWLVGRAVPGAWLVFFLLNGVLLLPGTCIHLLPPNTLSSISEAGKNISTMFIPHTTGGGLEPQESELIPEESPETMALLSLSLATGAAHEMTADEEDLASLLPSADIPVSDDNGDSSTFNSLTPALGMMPAHDEESIDGLELLASELEPVVQQPDEGIRFRHRHFNGNDESSSDEEGLGRGLSFPDPSSVAEASGGLSIPRPLAELIARSTLENVANSVAQTLAGAVGSLAPSLVTPSSSQQQQQQPQRRHSEDDDEDDFEIIDQEELPNIS